VAAVAGDADRVVRPVARSCTNASGVPLLSAGTRLLAYEVKATMRPSPLTAGSELS
jgi:hypothetical protein